MAWRVVGWDPRRAGSVLWMTPGAPHRSVGRATVFDDYEAATAAAMSATRTSEFAIPRWMPTTGEDLREIQSHERVQHEHAPPSRPTLSRSGPRRT